MLISNKLFVLISLFLALSCNRNSRLETALELAGDNKNELKKVLDYYKKDPADSLKYKAACFLIENLPGKVHNKGKYFEEIQHFFDYAGNLPAEKKTVNMKGNLFRMFDSTANIAKPHLSSIKTEYDINVLTSKYLIENIEASFNVWNKAKWKGKVPFSDFCEYILPYKILNETPENWRKQFMETYKDFYEESLLINNVDSAFRFLTDTLKLYYLSLGSMIDGTFSNFIKMPFGDCIEGSNYQIFVLRASGIPCALNFLLAWGNRKYAQHYFKSLVSSDRISDSLLFRNIEGRNNTDLIGTYLDFKITPVLEKGEVLFIKKVPKVYRKMYSLQEKMKMLNKEYPDEIHPSFRDLCMKDVSEEFIESCNVNVKVPENLSKFNIAYLCVFDIQGWKPVAIKQVENNNVTFEGMGKNILYQPAYYSNGELYPFDKPFILTLDNKKRYIETDDLKTRTILIGRKYPVFSQIAYYGNQMYLGRFYVSNDKNFTNPTIIHTIKTIPLKPTEFTVKNKQSFTYLKYSAHKDYFVSVGELEFFYEEKGELCKFPNTDFEVIGLRDGGEGRLFDNDYLTHYESKNRKDNSIIIKFFDTDKKIVKIRYCPKTDANFIEPGDYYELFYYNNNNEWHLLWGKTAKDFNISFDDVPENCLFWLRNRSKGVEERPFIYENGKQIFW